MSTLLQVASGLTVVQTAVGSQPSIIAELALWRTNQALGVSGSQRVEHGVVRRCSRTCGWSWVKAGRSRFAR